MQLAKLYKAHVFNKCSTEWNEYYNMPYKNTTLNDIKTGFFISI